MGKSHPLALREWVVAFVEGGQSHREAARHFRVSPRCQGALVVVSFQRITTGLANGLSLSSTKHWRSWFFIEDPKSSAEQQNINQHQTHETLGVAAERAALSSAFIFRILEVSDFYCRIAVA